MKLHLLPAWLILVLVGSLFIGPPAQAQSAAVLTAVPSGLRALGNPYAVGSEIKIVWVKVAQATSYNLYRDGALLTTSNATVVNDYAVFAGDTHSYAVSSVGPAGESALSSPVTVTVPLTAGGQAIYAESLENAWQSWSWATTDFANAAPSHLGHSIKITAGPWQAMYLYHDPFDTTPYTALSFWVHGGQTGGQRLQVKAMRNGVPQVAIQLLPLLAGNWQHVTLSLASLGVANVTDMDGFWIEEATGNAQPVFYVRSNQPEPGQLTPF